MNLLFSVARPTGPWEWLIIDVLDWIPNYGLRVIFLIVMLKLILLPIDFFQRKTSIDNARIMKRMQPKLEELQAQFGHDRQLLSMKQRALHKQEKYNPFKACLPAIVTLVIFLTLFSSFRVCSNYYNVLMVEDMNHTYSLYTTVTTERTTVEMSLTDLQAILDEMYNADVEAGLSPDRDRYTAEESDLAYGVDGGPAGKGNINQAKKIAGQRAVLELYETEYKPFMSFLLVFNVWQPDRNVSPIPTHQNIKDSLNALKGVTSEQKNELRDNYDFYIASVSQAYGDRWNGYFVYIVLAVGLNFLQQFIMTRQQKKAGDPQATAPGMNTMKMMMYFMPIMMGVFAYMQPASFTIYMVINATMGILVNLLSTFVLKFYSQKKEKEEMEMAQTTGVRSLRGVGGKANKSVVKSVTEQARKDENSINRPKK